MKARVERSRWAASFDSAPFCSNSQLALVSLGTVVANFSSPACFAPLAASIAATQRTITTEHQRANTKRRTPNEEHRTTNIERRASENEHRSEQLTVYRCARVAQRPKSTAPNSEQDRREWRIRVNIEHLIVIIAMIIINVNLRDDFFCSVDLSNARVVALQFVCLLLLFVATWSILAYIYILACINCSSSIVPNATSYAPIDEHVYDRQWTVAFTF